MWLNGEMLLIRKALAWVQSAALKEDETPAEERGACMSERSPLHSAGVRPPETVAHLFSLFTLWRNNPITSTTLVIIFIFILVKHRPKMWEAGPRPGL